MYIYIYIYIYTYRNYKADPELPGPSLYILMMRPLAL